MAFSRFAVLGLLTLLTVIGCRSEADKARDRALARPSVDQRFSGKTVGQWWWRHPKSDSLELPDRRIVERLALEDALGDTLFRTVYFNDVDTTLDSNRVYKLSNAFSVIGDTLPESRPGVPVGELGTRFETVETRTRDFMHPVIVAPLPVLQFSPVELLRHDRVLVRLTAFNRGTYLFRASILGRNNLGHWQIAETRRGFHQAGSPPGHESTAE